jgi:hypothetical protein
MLDVSRHFFNPEEVKQLLDAMALHKLNVFHWHLDDDSGWRLEILKWPLLTQVGAWRTNILFGLNPRSTTAWESGTNYGGYYSQVDAREIVAYAAQRHIMVVPEIEMLRLDRQAISPRCSPHAGDETGPFQLQQDLDEKPLGNGIRSGDFHQSHRFRPVMPQGQFQHREASILCFGRQLHGSQERTGTQSFWKPERR